MNSEEKNITRYFDNMRINIQEEAFKEFSNKEKKRLECLSERMNYLYNKMNSNSFYNENKFNLAKEEFRALEWILWEIGLISENDQKVSLGYFSPSVSESSYF